MADANALASQGVDWRRIGRLAAIVIGIVAVLWVLSLIPHTVIVFVLAALMAFGVNPIVLRLSKRMPRAAAIAVVYVVLVVLVLIAVLIIVPDTINQVQALYANSSTYLENASRTLNTVQDWLHARFRMHVLPPQFGDIEQHAISEATALAQSALSRIGSIVLGAVDAFIIGLAAVVISYYLLAHTAEIRSFYYSCFPARSQAGARAFAHEVARIFGGYMLANLLLFAFTALMTFIPLLFVHTQYRLLIAIVTGLLYLVPYLGILVALVIGMLLGLLDSVQVSIWIGVIIIGVTRISDYVIAPKLMGESVDISPVTVIFALFAGGELFGLWGLLLAIPAAALIKVVWNLWLRPWLRGEAPDYTAVARHKSISGEPEPAPAPAPARAAADNPQTSPT